MLASCCLTLSPWSNTWCLFPLFVRDCGTSGERIRSSASELSCSRSHDCIVQNMRVDSVRAARRKLVKLFKKPKSKFYWYDFTVRGRRYRASTQETKSVRALQIASPKLASVMERTDPLPTKPAVLQEFADRFLDWVNGGQTRRENQEVLP